MWIVFICFAVFPAKYQVLSGAREGLAGPGGLEANFEISTLCVINLIKVIQHNLVLSFNYTKKRLGNSVEVFLRISI